MLQKWSQNLKVQIKSANISVLLHNTLIKNNFLQSLSSSLFLIYIIMLWCTTIKEGYHYSYLSVCSDPDDDVIEMFHQWHSN